MKSYDKIILGAGLYGLYSALYCCKLGQSVLVLECDCEPFKRATYINQARVHQGYHYPRSLSTALKSAGYFEKFNKDYSFCINNEFKQIYATSQSYSWTSSNQFKEFCHAADIPCEELCPDNYFKPGLCDGAFLTREYTYDAHILRDYFLDKLSDYNSSCSIIYNSKIFSITNITDLYEIITEDGNVFRSQFILNATYASSNQLSLMAKLDTFKIKYELCEIILCDVVKDFKGIGFTVMDGPFFSIMPFGKTGYHSLTSVTFTPHTTSYDKVPNFSCQARSNGYCTSSYLGNCNDCPARPETAYPYMSSLAKKYLKDEYIFKYSRSLFSMKPILVNSEIDDSRPTVIRTLSNSPTFVSVLSGKINTVYDLDDILSNNYS